MFFFQYTQEILNAEPGLLLISNKGLARVLPVLFAPTINLLIPSERFIFQVSSRSSSHCDLAEKSTCCPNGPTQLQDLWGAKTALGRGHQRKGGHSSILQFVALQKEMAKTATVYYRTWGAEAVPWTFCWVGGNTRLPTSVRCGLRFYSQRMDFWRLLARSSQGGLVL